MKEVLVGDITFKVKDYLSYTDLDKLNLFGFQQSQMKIATYIKDLPKIEKGESNEDYLKRVNEIITSGEVELSDGAIKGLSEVAWQVKEFNRNIDNLLIIEPTLGQSRPTTIQKLKETPEYKLIHENVLTDIKAIMNPEQENKTPKND